MMIKSFHSMHLVDKSPWPLISSLNALIMAFSMIIMFKTSNSSLLIYIMIITSMSSLLWWRDVVRESLYQGLHTSKVTTNLKMGMIMFIISEVMFFFSFFWAYFHSSLSPSPEIGMSWPPVGITPFNPISIPLLNTLILLSSGVSITWAHHELLNNNLKSSSASLLMTLSLGGYFSALQYLEYKEAQFTMADSSYGATFFLATGFHGIHVLIGSSFLLVSLMRMMTNQFSKTHHLGFETAAWYWHFVDVIWLFLYTSIYWWGK